MLIINDLNKLQPAHSEGFLALRKLLPASKDPIGDFFWDNFRSNVRKCPLFDFQHGFRAASKKT